MNVDAKVWNTTKTGFKVHAFKKGGAALCRANIRGTHSLDKTAARRWVLDTPGLSFCSSCEHAFDFEVREAAWMAGRTQQCHAKALEMNAEFDAQAAPSACICPARTDYHTLACQAFQAAHSSTDTEENPPMALKDGPITPRQARIIGLASAGYRQQEIAKELGVSYPVIRMEVTALVQKFKADSSGQVYAMHARAEAYLSAAELIDDDIQKNYGDPDFTTVNEVLNGLANILRERAAALLPK